MRWLSLTILAVSINSIAFAQNVITISGTSQCTDSNINTGIKAVSTAGGGTVYVYCPSIAIAMNLWSGVTNPTKVMFGPATFTFQAQQILPNNTEVAGSGRSTVFQLASVSFTQSFDNGLFTNILNTGSNGPVNNVGISLHDFEIRGTGTSANSTAGVSFYNIEQSSIYRLYIQNVWLNGIDLRNASDVNVHDNWCVNCAAGGNHHHAIGGGVNSSNDVFIYNKFRRNHATGGGATVDHFDFFGQGQASNQRCGFNVIADNTSDGAPTVGIFLDTCNHNTVTGNIIRNSGSEGIACTSGVHNLDGGCAYNNFSNQIQSSGQQGYCFALAYENVVTGGEIFEAGFDGILLQDSYLNKIDNVSVYSPSRAQANAYSGITITSTGGVVMENTIQNNTLNDKDYQGNMQNMMEAGVCVSFSNTPPSPPRLCGSGSITTGVCNSRPNVSNNIVQNNHIDGGSAGTYGDGVIDNSHQNLVACNAYGTSGQTYPCTVHN
jgi:hypothetical protein